ncbi:MAG TPA: nuclear transport factor 2 family protein [Phnomibacter sp.]|nr:nuclear transport factor 2 family protein [Phnomibacter sp.]
MKKKHMIVALAFACLSTAGIAQSKEEKAVAASVEVLKNAMISGDSVALKNIASEKLSYGHSGGHVEGRDEFVSKIASGKSDFVTIELKDQSISMSGKVAIVRHILNATTNDNGKPAEVHLRVMYVFQKEGKQWKMLGRQAVKM